MAKAKKQEKSMEAALWEAANKLRGNVEPSEYKHVVLSLIFLKYASDKFEERKNELIAYTYLLQYQYSAVLGQSKNLSLLNL